MAHKENAKMAEYRDVIRCHVCSLVQFITRAGDCRRCRRGLFPKIVPQDAMVPDFLMSDDATESAGNGANEIIVKNLGKRIRELRELHGLTRTQLRACTGVSRTYLSRVESGEMTPKLTTIEKLAGAFGIGMSHFFVSPTRNEDLAHDPFMRELRSCLQHLDRAQWRAVIEKLQAISREAHAQERAVMMKRASRPQPAPNPAYYPQAPAAVLHG
jgi:HTH-type transcriptional repressor of puuD